MDIAIDVFNYFISTILIAVAITWTLLIRSMWISFRDSPYLDKFSFTTNQKPKVSIILPARNEENFIGKCLTSLLNQDYENYEIVVINDGSEDRTREIIEEFAQKNLKIISLTAKQKPNGWLGKNWACYEGFKKSTGDLLLFTDADTQHSRNTISLSVSHLLSENLDALTAIPRMICLDFWTRVTLPMLSTFLHTRFSALRVNDPSKKTGYFFGSFFIIKRNVYESVGTHEGVKAELVEDGALGKKVKESGYKMKMVRAEHLISAIWARDLGTLWHALKRLVIPLYLQNKKIAIGIFCAILFLLFIPFPIFTYSALLANLGQSFTMLFSISLTTVILLYIAAFIEARKGLGLGIKYAILGPIGSLIIVIGFASGILQVKSKKALTWRGRSYSMTNQVQNSISV